MATKTLIAFLLSVFLFSCNQSVPKNDQDSTSAENQETSGEAEAGREEFEVINTDEINRVLWEGTENLSAVEVMKLYYPHEVETGEGNEKITTSETTLDNGNTEITLIHDNRPDDSVQGEKYVMELKESNGNREVVSLKKNWKCREGRGHRDWGTELCK